MNIAVCCPTGRFVHSVFVQDLFEAVSVLKRDHGFSVSVFFESFSTVSRARYLLSKRVVECVDSFDWVLWIDSDHSFSASQIVELVRQARDKDLDCLSANYFVNSLRKEQFCAWDLRDGTAHPVSNSPVSGSFRPGS